MDEENKDVVEEAEEAAEPTDAIAEDGATAPEAAAEVVDEEDGEEGE